MKKQTTLADSILAMPTRTGPAPAVKFKKSSEWKEWSWTEYFEQILCAAAELKELGVDKGVPVAICCSTRVEWAILDLAVLSLHGIVIPVYPNSTKEELQYILKHSEAQFLFAEHQGQILDNISETKMKKQFCMDLGDWSFLNSVRHVSKHKEAILQTLEATTLDLIATIVYTSGTTGIPKGAVLTHQQVISEVSEAFPFCGANAKDTSLTFLPYAHVLGRIEIWAHVYIGYTMAYAESLESIRQDLQEIRPTFMIAVPRIFEKVYGAVWAQIQGHIARRKIFEWALEIGLEVGQKKLHRQNLSLQLVLQYELAKKAVLNQIKNAFGGRLRFAISGGAPLNHKISEFFHAAEILILEGYGLTETTAAICVNTPFNYRFGSVGRPIGDVQIKIAEDGEILVKSHKVMKEYYKNQEATAEALSNGWYHTGDIGELLPQGDLRITDRKKDLIKTAGGKYVAPQKLEGLLKLHPIISHALIHGDQKKYIVALLTIDQPFLEKMAKDLAWSYQDWKELLQKQEIKDLIRTAVTDTNSKLASYETIKKYTILSHDFTIDAGELTASLKVKRKFLDQKYKKQIEALY